MKKLVAFLRSKTFLANLVLATASVALVLFLFDVWLGSYTRHGEAIVVPDLTRMSLDEVEETLGVNDLEFAVLDSAEFNPKWPGGAVVDQYPRPGAKVKIGREIKLTLNPYRPRLVEVPVLLEKTKRRAIYDLESKGFVVGTLKYVPYLGRDVVVGVERNGVALEPGVKLSKGTIIDLVLGQGLSDEQIPMPSLFNKTLAQATAILQSHSLNVGALLYDAGVADSSSAKVYRQSPSPSGAPTVFMGTQVDLWLTEDYTKIPTDTLSFLHASDSIHQITL